MAGWKPITPLPGMPLANTQIFAVPGAASLFHSFCTGAEAATAIIGAIGAAEVSVTM